MSGQKPTNIVPDRRYPGMFRLRWRNGDLSADMYNLTRANDILRNYDRYVESMAKADRMKGNRLRCSKTAADAKFSGGR
jgi:hypothetical protein